MLTDIYSIILIIIVIILLLQYDLKYILIIVFIIGLVLYYINNTNIHGSINEINNINKNDIITDILNELEENKDLNLIEYKYGLKFWNLFMNKYNNINNTYEYEKCKSLLLNCIEHFKSLNLSPENNNIIISIEKLYSEGEKLLKQEAKKLNLSWEKEPNITKKQIILDAPLPYNVSFNLQK